MEQVCAALNQLCEEWQESQRGTSRRQHRLATIRYHQQRNRAARESRQKGCGRRDVPRAELINEIPRYVSLVE